MLRNPNLFVVTGGPGSGKTTVVRELEGRGFQFVPEVARQIIQEQVRAGGIAVPWGDREHYAQLMLKRSIQSYRAHTPAPVPTFSDRGIPDTLCYARLIGLPDESSARRACVEFRYADRVFFAPAWREIYESDSERKQDFDEAVRTADLMRKVYRECGYQLIELPQVAPAERAEFVLKEMQQNSGRF
jgi:predicted ATPase